MIRFKKVDFSNFEYNLSLLKAKLTDFKDKIIVCYLFGSAALREFKPLSDIDIAVLYYPDVNQNMSETMILIDIMSIMNTDEIDLINLSETPLHIQYEILKKKEILFCSNNEKRIGFETRVIKEYIDFRHILEEHEQSRLQRLGIGGHQHG